MELSNIKIEELLTRKLAQKGVDPHLIPLLMRALSNAFFINPTQNLFQINERLHYLGWGDVKLDYHIFTLVQEILSHTAGRYSGPHSAEPYNS